jgi:hypothetical protein
MENKVLTSKYGSDKTPLHLGELSIPCYVLEDGTRVFSGRGIQNLLGVSSKSSGTWLSKFINSKSISTNLLPGIYDKLSHPIKFKRPTASGSQSGTYGYEVTLLIDLCNAITDAYDSREYQVSEEYYKAARIITRAVSKVGIIALVDEATGYDKYKGGAKDELQKFLNKFISDEASKWVKTFDDNFFEMIYRMRGWNWEMTNKRPGVVGQWINDIVYERVAPFTLIMLNEKNPKDDKGHRKVRHHQYFTEDVGKPRLKSYLASVEALGRASNYDWKVFMELLNRAFPKQLQNYLNDDELSSMGI